MEELKITTSKASNKRILWIDLTRAVGMLLIIWGHSLMNPNDWLGSMIFAVNVPIFFVLSGYLYHSQTLKKQIYKLFYNLIIPYISISLLMWLVSVILYLFKLRETMIGLKTMLKMTFFAIGTPINLIDSKIYMPAIGAIRFLVALFWASIIFNLIMKNVLKLKYGFWVGGGIFLILLFFGFGLTKGGVLPWSLNAALIGTFFLWFGNLMRRVNIFELGKAKLSFISAICSIIWIISGFYNRFWLNIAYADNKVIAVVAACCASVVLMLTCHFIEKICSEKETNTLRIIATYGKDSLVVLCVHIIDLNVLMSANYIQKMLIGATPNFLITMVVVICHVLITLIFLPIFKKGPVLRNIYFNRDNPFSYQLEFYKKYIS